MSGNYFSIERDGKSWEHLNFYGESKMTSIQEIATMTYDDIRSYEHIDTLIVATMDAANKHFGEDDAQTILTLIGEDGVFIWSILITPTDTSDEFRYAFVDWQKDGKKYRYEPLGA